jgi:hypothetical protein
MTIQIFLTLALGTVAVLVGVQQTTSRLVRVGVLAVLALGMLLVWAPETTNALASALGVGRGADLLFYLWVVITFALILFLYLKILRLGRKVSQLTRAHALAHPMRPDVSRDAS